MVANVSHNNRLSPVISPDVFDIYSAPIFFIYMKQWINSHGLVIAYILAATCVSICVMSITGAAVIREDKIEESYLNVLKMH